MFCRMVKTFFIVLKLKPRTVLVFYAYFAFVSVMSKNLKMDTSEYPNKFGFHIMNRTNMRIYSDATYLPNKYPNIFVRRK